MSFSVEYAKSGKSKCKKCFQPIVQDSVRVGKLERSEKFDGEYYVWRHVACFRSEFGGQATADELKGLTNLRWDDQQKLKQQFGSSSQATDGDDEDDEDDDDGLGNLVDFVVEYAKSNRSTCRGCHQKIDNAALRFGRIVENPDGYSNTLWFHADCAQLPPHIAGSSSITGYSSLKPADKKRVDQLVAQQLSSSAAAASQNQQAQSEQKKKADEERKIVERMWKIKDELKNDYKTDALRAMLRFNKQSDQGGPSELLDRIADARVRGCLPECPDCHAPLVLEDPSKAKCSGYASVWSKCTYSTVQFTRSAWKQPTDEQIEEVMEAMHVKKIEKKEKQKEMIYGTTATAGGAGSKKQEQASESLFEGMVFALLVPAEQKSDLQEPIVDHGGKAVQSVTKTATHVLINSTQLSALRRTAQIEKAVGSGLPLLAPEFIEHALQHNNAKADLEQYLVWKDGQAQEAPASAGGGASSTPMEASATSNNGGGAGGKRKAVEREPEERTSQPSATKKKKRNLVDENSELQAVARVLEDGDHFYHAVLNLTDLNVGTVGRNSFYLIQLLQHNHRNAYYLFTRWGRVGQVGQFKLTEFGSSKQSAVEEFMKKYFEKTGNAWHQRHDFKKLAGKMFPVDVNVDDEPEPSAAAAAPLPASAGPRGRLDSRVAAFVKLIFDENMFKDTMKKMDLDLKKMPLGQLTKAQVQRGYEVLEEIEQELRKPNPSRAVIVDGTNRFYTIIPHDFGEQRPPVIDNQALLDQRYDLLSTLNDIEVAARILKEERAAVDPIEANYAQLHNKIDPVDRNTDEWRMVEAYVNNTQGSARLKLLEVFRLDRQTEDTKFKQNDALVLRKLLFHGSKVAVFAAILSGGLKIMPHSGGRVGRGVYHADCLEKSAGYVGLSGNIGLVLLNEVALGDVHAITRDDPSLTRAPKGAHSVLARGTVMPNPKNDLVQTTMSVSGHPVIVPQGPMANVTVSSTFLHNEYLVYNESQVHMKYLLKLQWPV